MLNRKAGPISHNLTKLIIPEIQEYEWANGTKVCEINLGSQDITKIEIVHKAGRRTQILRTEIQRTALLPYV